MNKHETTEERVRSANEIDFREVKAIAARAKSGDKIAQAEIENLSETLRESGFLPSTLANDIVNNYILFFNKTHETDFDSLDQIEKYLEEHETTVEEAVDFGEIVETMVTRPRDYVHTLGKLTDKVFENKITLKKGQKGKHSIFLDKKKTISIFASVNYDQVLQDLGEKAKVPELTDDDRQVLDGIITNLVAGNNIMTYDMIYRGFTGKIDNGDLYIPEEIYTMIDTALDHFRGILLIDNAPEVEVKGEKTTKSFFDGPILHFDRLQRATINGKEIDGNRIGLIIVHAYPSLYLFAQANGNEIDTRDIKLLNVPKLNNTPENLKLRRYLYNRVISMRNNYERNSLISHKPMSISRKIRFDSVFEYIGATDIDRKRKYKIVQKIDLILTYWKDFGLIVDYEKTRKKGSNEIDGVEIHFAKRVEKKDSE